MAELPHVRLGALSVSRLIVGGNPFSGYSHLSAELDREVKRYFTVARIKATLAEAERLGIDTFCGRADNHIMRLLGEYWEEGGRVQWLAQSAPERSSIVENAKRAKLAGAKAFYVHGGVADKLLEARSLGLLREVLAAVREMGLAPGIAGHNPATHRAAIELGLDVDFHMVCFYHPASRMGKTDEKTEEGRYAAADREAAVKLIREIEKPCIGYKVLAAGRGDPREAIPYAFRKVKPSDAVCVGVYPGRNPKMIEEDVGLAREAMGA